MNSEESKYICLDHHHHWSPPSTSLLCIAFIDKAHNHRRMEMAQPTTSLRICHHKGAFIIALFSLTVDMYIFMNEEDQLMCATVFMYMYMYMYRVYPKRMDKFSKWASGWDYQETRYMVCTGTWRQWIVQQTLPTLLKRYRPTWIWCMSTWAMVNMKILSLTEWFVAYLFRYYETPPGYQYLHCLINKAQGGANFFLDSFKVLF